MSEILASLKKVGGGGGSYSTCTIVFKIVGTLNATAGNSGDSIRGSSGFTKYTTVTIDLNAQTYSISGDQTLDLIIGYFQGGTKCGARITNSSITIDSITFA